MGHQLLPQSLFGAISSMVPNQNTKQPLAKSQIVKDNQQLLDIFVKWPFISYVS